MVPLEHALAVDLAAILGRMLDEGNRGTGAAVDAGQRLSVMADPRTNSLLLRTPSKARLNLAKALIWFPRLPRIKRCAWLSPILLDLAEQMRPLSCEAFNLHFARFCF